MAWWTTVLMSVGIGLAGGSAALHGQHQRAGALPASVPRSDCDEVVGLEPLLGKRDLLLLGEMHGTVESPAFADCAVHRALAAGRSVTVAIELPIEEAPRVQAFVASAGSPADRDALLAGPFWQAVYQDGRQSQAMLEYLEDVRRLDRAGRPVHLLLLDSVGFVGGPERDRAMAARLLDAIASAPRDLFVVLTGNLHTRIRRGTPWNPAYEPMGFVLTQRAPKLRIAVLDVVYSGGTAWICETPQPESCGAKVLKGRPEGAARKVTVFPSIDASGYNGTYAVGRLTASPPAVPRSAHPAVPTPAATPGRAPKARKPE
jgi:hypothetical protein